MDKIIVRNKVLGKGQAFTNFKNIKENHDSGTWDEYIKTHGLKIIMRYLFDEDVDSEIIYETTLFNAFENVQENNKENEYFSIMYKLDEGFCVHLTGNIYLYRLVPPLKFANQVLVPWAYVDTKLYYGDTWWETDNEILHSFNNLSILDFIKRYRAY